jgi:hypothetical protein
MVAEKEKCHGIYERRKTHWVPEISKEKPYSI